MMQPSVKVQIAPQSVPSMPSWFGEVVILAHILSRFGLILAIEEHVRLARARFGQYEVIDFLVVLLGYAVSGEPTLEAFYARLAPFSEAFMALFERSALPHPSTLSPSISPVWRLCALCFKQIWWRVLKKRLHLADCGIGWETTG